MSMSYIRKTYGVPAKRGGRVEYSGNPIVRRQRGTIVGTDGPYIRVRFDGAPKNYIVTLHPAWAMRYLDGDAK